LVVGEIRGWWLHGLALLQSQKYGAQTEKGQKKKNCGGVYGGEYASQAVIRESQALEATADLGVAEREQKGLTKANQQVAIPIRR